MTTDESRPDAEAGPGSGDGGAVPLQPGIPQGTTKAGPDGLRKNTGGGRSADGWITVVATAIFGVLSVVSSLEVPPRTKVLIGAGIVLALVVGTLTGLAYFYRKHPQVAGVTNFVALVLVVAAASLAPVLLLGTDARILALELAGIAFLALLPGWLYIQFVAVKGRSLWDEYVLNLHRLHADDVELLPEPPEGSSYHRSWAAARPAVGAHRSGTGRGQANLYELKFQGLYGAAPKDGSGTGGSEARIHGENLLPVLVHTLLLAAGWTMVFQPPVVFGVALLPAGFAASTLEAILPDEPLRFAFAGAYFYILQMLVRRYFQDDLKTSAYINATVRVVVTALLVATIHVVWPADWTGKEATAFLIGVFPQLGLQALRSLVAFPLRRMVPSLRTLYPLSALDGMNIWYESRLLEEGIEDVQNLATANVVDVMLRTRIPVDRLVDWIDQAHLYLHLWPERPPEPAGGGRRERRKRRVGDITDSESRDTLRRHGIRTATDLENVFDPEADDAEFLEQHRWLLNPEGSGPSVTETIYRVLEDEPNLHHVRSWKRSGRRGFDRAVQRPAETAARPQSPRRSPARRRAGNGPVAPRA